MVVLTCACPMGLALEVMGHSVYNKHRGLCVAEHVWRNRKIAKRGKITAAICGNAVRWHRHYVRLGENELHVQVICAITIHVFLRFQPVFFDGTHFIITKTSFRACRMLFDRIPSLRDRTYLTLCINLWQCNFNNDYIGLHMHAMHTKHEKQIIDGIVNSK